MHVHKHSGGNDPIVGFHVGSRSRAFLSRTLQSGSLRPGLETDAAQTAVRRRLTCRHVHDYIDAYTRSDPVANSGQVGLRQSAPHSDCLAVSIPPSSVLVSKVVFLRSAFSFAPVFGLCSVLCCSLMFAFRV